MKPATIVSAAAITGDSQPISRDGSGRASSLSRMALLDTEGTRLAGGPGAGPHATHPHADLLDVGLADRLRRRQPTLRDHREPVAHLEQFVELLRQHEDRDALVAQVDDLLPDERRGADVDAPRRLR